MAGFREFVTGEVLTAANVNDFLMKQSVQKYADAAARDAALGATVGGGNALRQGMVAYLDSTNDLLKYDGNDWVGVGGGLVQLVRATDSTDRTTTSASFVDASLEVTITPTDASNTLVFIWSASFSYSRTGGNPSWNGQITDSSNTALSGAESISFNTINEPSSGAEGGHFTAIASIVAGGVAPATYKARFARAVGSVTLRNSANTGQLYVIEVAA